jgi:hypothetical protein
MAGCRLSRVAFRGFYEGDDRLPHSPCGFHLFIARLELGRAYRDEKLHRDAAKKPNGHVRAAPKISARKTER